MKTIKLLALAALALGACGDNKAAPDARIKDSSGPSDAYCSNCPAAPTLGAQIDRMGRPAVNTALNHGFDSTATATTNKKAYNEQTTLAQWTAQAQVVEFMSNLGIVDVLDTGVCGNAICETGETMAGCAGDCPTGNGPANVNGCGNQAMFSGTTGYLSLASLLAVDHMYLDTSKAQCALYLAVEFGFVTGGGNTTCGGRAPQYDVIDFSFSMLSMGTGGFVLPAFEPKVKDGVDAHTDYTADFPYLGPPH